MFIRLTSFSELKFGPPNKLGQREALGRFWRFIGPDTIGALDLFVAAPGGRPAPKAGAFYQVIGFPGKTGSTEVGFIGHNRKNNRLYRILQSAGGE